MYFSSLFLVFLIGGINAIDGSKFKPGTFLEDITIPTGKNFGYVVTQYSLITGQNYTSEMEMSKAPIYRFISAQEELYFVISTDATNRKFYIDIFDYSSNTPTHESSCELKLTSFFGCVVYSNGDIYFASADGSLYILSRTCEDKEIMSVPITNLVSSCDVDEMTSTLYYGNETHLFKITLPPRKLQLFPLPDNLMNQDYYQYIVGQNSSSLFLMTSGNFTALYNVELKNQAIFNTICESIDCFPSIMLPNLLGVDDRYTKSDGPLFVSLTSNFSIVFLDSDMTYNHISAPLDPHWGYYGDGIYDQYGEIFVG